MSVTTVNGITINKLNLNQYKELKNNNSLVTNESYVITDLDEYIDEINHLRVNKIIVPGADILFSNPNFHDFSELPMNTLLFSMRGTNNINFNYYLRYENGLYKMKMEASNGYTAVTYQGSSKNNMNLEIDEYTVFTNGYGVFAKIIYIIDEYKYILDDIVQINKSF